MKRLQQFLMRFPGVFPDGAATGYFGKLTEEAVKRYQKMNGLDPIGIVGPRTRAKVNDPKSLSSLATNPPASTSASAPVTMKTATSTKTAATTTSVVPTYSYGGGGGGGGGSPPPPAPPDTTPPSVSIVAPAASSTLFADFILSATTTDNASVSTLIYYIDGQYYGPGTTGDVSSSSVTVFKYLYATGTHALSAVAKDTSNNYATATISVVFTSSPPVISSISATSSASAATTTWSTDIAATSDVYYSSTSPLFTGVTTHVGVSGTSTSHSVPLTGLNASTTYYYAVVSVANGLTATSSTQSFTTLAAGATSSFVSSVDLSSFLPQRPWGITMNGSDYVVAMVDLGSSTGRLLRVTPLGTTTTIATFNKSIYGVGFDGTDYLVSDGNTNIMRVTQAGATSTLATGVTANTFQSEITMSSTSAVVTDYANGRLRIVTATGTISSLGSGMGNVKSVTNDGTGYVVVGGTTLYRVTATGTVSTFATSTLMGVVAKLGSNFYFTDGNNNLTKVTSGGAQSSGGAFSSAQIQGMTVSGTDLIGTDYTNARLLRITPL